MKVYLVVAVDLGMGIGKEGRLPWPHIPSDMKRFREITLGKVVIMGRKTFESLGRSLQGRTNVVVTRDPDFTAEGVTVVRTPQEAYQIGKESGEIYVIGGTDMYREFLPIADGIHMTMVANTYNCDRFFPGDGDWLLKSYALHGDAFDPVDTTYIYIERRNAKTLV